MDDKYCGVKPPPNKMNTNSSTINPAPIPKITKEKV